MNIIKNLKRFFLGDNFLCTLFILGSIWVIVKLPYNFEIISPLEDALKDFEITDLCFSHFAAEDTTKIEKNVTLVNISNLNRAGIAKQIKIINKYDPAVIGIDCFFSNRKDTLNDKILAQRLKNIDNLVMVSKLKNFNTKTMEFDSIEKSHPLFSGKATAHGFANMITENNEFRTCRTFPPEENHQGKQVKAFGVKVAQLFDSSKVEKFLSRNKDVETIFYKGNILSFGNSIYDNEEHGKYTAIDYDQLFNGQFEPEEVIKDRIVLMGYMGKDLQNMKFWDQDRFYTPLNEQYAGKSFPDMFGVVVHANIISMILDENYIYTTSSNIEIPINLIICFLNVVLFSFIYYKLTIWYDGISLFVQLLETLLILALILFIFEQYHIKMNFDLAIGFILLCGNFIEIYYGFVKVGYVKYLRNKFNYSK